MGKKGTSQSLGSINAALLSFRFQFKVRYFSTLLMGHFILPEPLVLALPLVLPVISYILTSSEYHDNT